jgi:electron transport complex protein RnfE
VGIALADGIGVSIGFGLGLASIATVREILGSGTWLELRLLPEAWPNWGIMVLPPGAFLTLGLLIALWNWYNASRASRAS